MLMLTAVFLGSSTVQMSKSRTEGKRRACVRAEKEGVHVFFLFVFSPGLERTSVWMRDSLKHEIESCPDLKHFQDQ